ncbi:hypothetical protein [Actinacidiphila rubida]|uniref:Uncharacterized protein n=1 Tax=Actinacidiphila rubida TaxID=310780 RepID=A0A1H8P0L0_9ACTN|nr:hypothetical protein SAMN05216267_102437 [Actinacidiphila rubida]
MADTPGALQLRLLQTVVDVAAERNSTLDTPFPAELLRFFEQHDDGAHDATPPRTDLTLTLTLTTLTLCDCSGLNASPNASPLTTKLRYPSPAVSRLLALTNVESLSAFGQVFL